MFFQYSGVLFFSTSSDNDECMAGEQVRVIYLNREADTNQWWKIATNKQKKTMELVHNSA